MRLKAPLTAIFSVLAAIAAVLAPANAHAQVKPAARIGGLPIGVGFGISSYNLDYGPNRRMEGPVIRASVGVFHGFGIDVSARSIFMFTPPTLSRMQQSTFLAGGFYEGPLKFHMRPFARYAGGIGVIEFPSNNPYYTRDAFTVYAPSGGVEIPVVEKVYIRAEYEYQFWKKYQGPNDLTPQGYTIGVTYYVTGMHTRRHDLD
jgi:opacity protein-like surface antigen